MLRSTLLIICSSVLVGCANHLQALKESVPDKSVMVLEESGFPVVVLAPRSTASDRHMRVFIEGDGRAWITRSSPSLDPTPTKSFLVELSQQEPGSAYMGRPCQYVLSEKCRVAYWTSHRFGREVLDSMTAALDALKAQRGVESFELVGYSGGGAMALLLAGARDDVRSVQTLAGNLAPAYWAASRKLTPLDGSLEPASMRDRLQAIPQRHFYGLSDQVVPYDVATHYRDSIGDSSCLELVAVQATHSVGWPEAWRRYRDEPLECTADSAGTK